MFQEKVCTKCEEKRSTNEYYKDKCKKDGYASSCKDCQRKYWQSDKGIEAKERYNKSNKAKEAVRRAVTRYQNTAHGKEVVKQYKKSTRGRRLSVRYAETRRTRKTKAGGSYTESQWYKLCECYDFRCLRCNKQFSFKELTLDHVKPVSKGGSSFIWNIQPLCSRCNSKKGRKEIDYRKSVPDWIDRDTPIWIQDTLF